MKTRIAAFAVGAVCLIAACMVLGRYLRPADDSAAIVHQPEYRGIVDISDLSVAGRMLHLAGDFRGQINLFDPKNRDAGLVPTSFGYPDGEVDITAGTSRFRFVGAGRYAMRDSKGVLLGYAVLTPATPKQIAQENAQILHPPARFEDLVPWVEQKMKPADSPHAVAAGTWCLAGCNWRRSAYWVMRGVGLVTITDSSIPSTDKLGISRISQKELDQYRMYSSSFGDPVPPDSEIKSPRLAFTVDGDTTYASGYGAYPIKDSNGQVLMTIRVDPPKWVK